MRPVLIGLATFYLLFIAPLPVYGQVVDKETAAKVCEGFLSNSVKHGNKWAGSSAPSIARTRVLQKDLLEIGYCFDVSSGGFVIVPKFEQLPPIIAHSQNGVLEFSRDNGLYALIVDDLEAEVRFIVENFAPPSFVDPLGGIEVLPSRRPVWQALVTGEDCFVERPLEKDSSSSQMGNLLVPSDWHQGDPFNSLCPLRVGFDENNQIDVRPAKAGCVAIAAAQLMNYHKWPISGTGSKSGVDFSDEYDWDNMKDYYYTWTADERDAVAELVYEVGIAVDMDYGYYESSADTYDLIHLLPGYFGYSPEIERVLRELSSDQWYSFFQEIRTEIEAERPCIYRYSGHALVCDGYDILFSPPDQYVYQIHLNYGWYGTSIDIFYSIYEHYTPGVDLVNGHYILKGIKPGTFGEVSVGEFSVEPSFPSWGDWNKDGYPDVAAIQNQGASTSGLYLWENQGGEGFTFSDLTGYLGSTVTSGSPAWGDYNNDGWEDLLVSGNPSKLLRNEQGTHFTDDSTTLGFSEGYAGKWVDFDCDGLLDLAVRGSDDRIHIYLSQFVCGNFCETTPPSIASLAGCREFTFADLDGDGDPDLLVCGVNGVALIENDYDGHGHFTNVAPSSWDGVDCLSISCSDYDSDGDVDVFLRANGATGGAHCLMRNDGNFIFENVTPALLADLNILAETWFDADNDGDEDLLTYRWHDGGFPLPHLSVWFNQGSDFTLDLQTEFVMWRIYGSSSLATGVSCADFNLDGKLDIFARFPVVNYSGNGNWISMHLNGLDPYRNGGAVGARVELSTNGTTQVEYVSGGGIQGQNSRILHFGVGEEDIVENMEIIWPSGRRQVRRNYLSNRSHEFYEPMSTDVPSNSETMRYGPAQNSPNPFNPGTYIGFAVPFACDAEIDIYDIAGRLVRTLKEPGLDLGEHKVYWDGKNGNSEEMPSGTYLYRIQAGGFSDSGKMLLVK
jgi:Peptidase C10 family/ASPIC and UnbV/FG-GAP-like repeat/FlgD Ig-like domain